MFSAERRSTTSRLTFVLVGGKAARPLRSCSAARLIALAGLAGVLCMAVGIALGVRLAAPTSEPLAAHAAQSTASPVPIALAVEQLGALSARLVRLESQAARLGERVGLPILKSPASPSSAPGSGGPMLAPRSASADELDAQLELLEEQLDLVADAATDQQVGRMRLPTRRPIEGGALSSPFGNRIDPLNGGRAFHAGLDFSAPAGTPIVAAAGGTVAYAGFRADYGWTVEIDHGNGLATRYAHASRLLIGAGALVMPGERIALVGSTGRSTGPHLHFEVLRDGAQVNPRRYLAGL